jgi:tetratricopeptide (TPR) repeat protein
MPKSVVSIKAEMRDHSISVPVPENTMRHGIPNACNLCHTDKKPKWAVQALNSWYPGSPARQKLIRRAETFSQARSGDAGALSELIAIAGAKEEGPLARANALGYMSRYTQTDVVSALLQAVEDDHPLVRSMAALKLGQIEDADLDRIGPTLANALSDSSRIVRMNASLSLLNRGVRGLKGEAGRLFEETKKDHVARAAIYPDDAETQLNLGKFYVMLRDAEGAARAFDTSYQLAPDQPGIKYFLALARIGQERYDDARKLLKDVDKKDPYRQEARDLLGKIKDGR